MAERMKIEQIRHSYPDQYVGLKNPVYEYGVLESAEVAYTENNAMILFWRQIMEPDILIWHTGVNPPMVTNIMFLF